MGRVLFKPEIKNYVLGYLEIEKFIKNGYAPNRYRFMKENLECFAIWFKAEYFHIEARYYAMHIGYENCTRERLKKILDFVVSS